jgi:hypothetical protein
MRTLVKPIIFAVGLAAASPAVAVDPQRVGDCADFADRYQATAEASERFAQLRGSCEGVYDIGGALYARAEMVVRSNRAGTLRLYLPASDQTVEVKPDMSRRVYVGGRKVRVRDLNRGDEIGLYLSLDRFAEDRVTEVAFATEEGAAEEVYVEPVQEVTALPTTASPLPALGIFSGLLLAAGLFLRGYRRSA